MTDTPRSAASTSLADLARQMRENSERWFPKWHADDLGMPLTVAYALGLSGEVGEVANVVKKQMRDGDDADLTEGLGAELADCFTYLLLLADECNVDLLAEYEQKRMVNELRRGHPEPWTWATVPIGWYVPGSGIVTERRPHHGGFHVTHHRLTPFEEDWTRFRVGGERVPTAITSRGLLYDRCKPPAGARVLEVGHMVTS